MFDYGYPEIAQIIGKSEDAARQLASRARRQVGERRPRFQSSREQRDQLVQRFLAAAEQGDMNGLEALLANDVVLSGDGGGRVPALARSLHGRNRVARTLRNWMRIAGRIPGFELRPAEVNGGAGVLATDGRGGLISVWSLGISGGQIQGICAVVNPDKLAHLGAVVDFAALIGRGAADDLFEDKPHHPGGTP